jgi:hypothetical protein
MDQELRQLRLGPLGDHAAVDHQQVMASAGSEILPEPARTFARVRRSFRNAVPGFINQVFSGPPDACGKPVGIRVRI